MADRFILSPYFLGESWPGLLGLVAEPLGAGAWVVNEAEGGAPEAVRRAVQRGLAEAVSAAIERAERPVSVAGDCCTAIAVLAGLRRAGCEPSLLWFDAHGDFNTAETSPSGFLGGMPLAMLVGRGEDALLREVGVAPLEEERVVLSDARDLDRLEAEALAGSRVRHVPEVGAVEAELPAGPLWVHFDADVVDAGESPGHRYAAPGGPSAAALGEVFGRIAASQEIVAVSVSTWDPELDPEAISRRLSMALVARLLGGKTGSLG